MSTVTISVTAESVTVEGAAGGTAEFELTDGAWAQGLTSKTGTVRLLAIARPGTEPTVRHYTADGEDDFPAGWTFTDDTPAKTVIETVGDAHLIG